MKHLVVEGLVYQRPNDDGAMRHQVLLVDSEGMLTCANHALKHWDAEIAEAGSLNLHTALHSNCSDPGCHLERFWRNTKPALLKHGSAGASFWDSVLQRHLEIRTYLPAPDSLNTAADCFAVAVVADVSAYKLTELRTRQAHQAPAAPPQPEAPGLNPVQSSRALWPTLLDKMPLFAAMADHGGALFYLNPYGRTLLGLSAQDVLTGLTLTSCQAPQARIEFVERGLPQALREGSWSANSLLIGPEQQDICVQLTLISHHDALAQLEGYTLLGQDMSASVRAGEALRTAQDKVSRLAAQHLTIQESERRRIATDLHDGLGQTLSLIKMSIDEVARFANAENAPRIAATVEELGKSVKTALSELRRTAMNLRPSTLDHLGIKATLAWHFREFEAASTGLSLERDIRIEESDVPDPLKITIYRIVQEAMGNALKHANAAHIHVSLHCTGGVLELAIDDDGQGFEIEQVLKDSDFTHGIGLQSMFERAQLSGGKYELISALGQGTKIQVRWGKDPAHGSAFALLGRMASTAEGK